MKERVLKIHFEHNHSKFKPLCSCPAAKRITSNWTEVTCRQCMGIHDNKIRGTHKTYIDTKAGYVTRQWCNMNAEAPAYAKLSMNWDGVTCQRCLRLRVK